jgi:hypothetical protein
MVLKNTLTPNDLRRSASMFGAKEEVICESMQSARATSILITDHTLSHPTFLQTHFLLVVAITVELSGTLD